MNYRALNKFQKNKIKTLTNNAYVMEWESPEFMDYLMGELPKIRTNQNDKDVEKEILALEKTLSTYDAFFSKKITFLKKIEKHILTIHNSKKYWYGLSLDEIKTYMKLHSFCLISGVGGIGKSYFIKCLEDKLEEKNINHLCIYGKFEKDTNNIDVEEIIKASNAGFIFIVDAINEMSEVGQHNLLGILTELKKYPRIRIIISYRTNSMDNTIIKKYQNISEYEYKFPGVAFESALSEILKLAVPDIYMYENILHSNNALLLSMLCDVLSSNKIVDETENGIASITFILEQYIKKSINKAFKGLLPCQGIDVWNDTKKVARWMYKNEKKSIDENSLLLEIKTGKHFLSSMLQLGFIDVYENDNENYYYFLIDSLSDFLAARSLFEDIRGKEYKDKVDIIKSKVEVLYNLEEPLIMTIFDSLAPDYKKINNLLIDTGLIDSLNFSTLVKIHFNQDNIADFLSIFEPINHSNLLQEMGGYTDKPFNSKNYLFAYYCSNHERLCDLSNTLAGNHSQTGIKNRLKNMLYFTTLNIRADRRDDEAFYFSLLCCASPNKDVRCLATKLLYEVVSKNNNYIDKVIVDYNKISDFYIQEAIIYVLSQSNKDNNEITDFFIKIIENQDNLSAKSIRRISTYFRNPYGYIKWSRKNLFNNNKDAFISDYLNEILFHIELMNKDFLPFRYWGKDHIEMHTQFLLNDKPDIEKANDFLSKKYHCVCDGECNGLMAFEEIVMPEIKQILELDTMDINSFLENFETVFRYVFEYFRVSTDRASMNEHGMDFHHSAYMKCVDIATGFYYGSLMCNYYTNQFATYNNSQNSIGYEIYDPLEYGEDIIITAPIPTYQDFIERLGEYSINSLELPVPHDIQWVRNVELTRRNVLRLLEKIKFKNQEWIMLASRISLHEKGKYSTKWKDSYNIWCCTSEDETINDDGNARYLTIELDEYFDDMKLYPDNTSKPWLCKRVNNINSQSEVFAETSLVLPPSEIINFLNLKLNTSDLSWETQDKKKIIICNNNKNSYYNDPIGGSVFIRKDNLDKFLERHTIKYFAFSERFIPETGYADETSLHFEIANGKILKEINNGRGRCEQDIANNPLCSVCPHTNIVERKIGGASALGIEWVQSILAEYGAASDIE